MPLITIGRVNNFNSCSFLDSAVSFASLPGVSSSSFGGVGFFEIGPDASLLSDYSNDDFIPVEISIPKKSRSISLLSSSF